MHNQSGEFNNFERPLYSYTLRCFQMILAFYGNLVFLLAMWSMKKFTSNMHLIMISLACADLCGSLVLVFTLIWDFLVTDRQAKNILCITASFLSRETLILNILHLCLMAGERWAAIKLPHR